MMSLKKVWNYDQFFKMKCDFSCNPEMLRMIDVLNKLQNKLLSIGVTNLIKELPQIAVIGSQSAGKSSVLESFVGRDFLPRGNDIVTRRPLILQLKHNKEDQRTYAKFNHSPEVFTDFDKVRLEIEEETERTVPDSGISSAPINLMITSPHVLDLNLVDLPGLTKVPVGRQPENIEAIVRDLIMEFISKENCLILAVTPANQDLSTSDAIKLAREVDPLGRRTIGVLTKLDLMDEGTDVRKILLKEHKIKLNKGFIGVICRSQKDIESNKSLSQAIDDEMAFFTTHSAYKDLMSKLGIENLQKYLQKELAQHLFKELPVLRARIENDLYDVNERVESIGLELKEMNTNDLISHTLESLRQNFKNEIGSGDEVPVDRTTGGANINIKMNVEYPEQIGKCVRSEKLIKIEIRNTIMNIFGTRLELFMPNKVFVNVVRQQIELMREPSLKCVDSVYNELETIVRNSAKGIERFPKIIDLYSHLTLDFLRECKKECRKEVKHFVDTQKSYINTNNPEFLRAIELEKKNQELPLIKLMVNENPEDPVKSGHLIVNDSHGYVSIQNHWIHCYQDRFKNEIIAAMNLKIVQATFGKKWMVLKDPKNRIKFDFESNENLLEWIHAILPELEDLDYLKAKCIENKNELEQKDETDVPNVKYPIKMEGQVDEVLNLVVAYIKIVENTLKDTIPKLCQKELIDSTQHFIAIKLRGRVQSKELTLEELVDVDPMEEERKRLLYLKHQYEEALKTMKEVLKPSN